jgi:hypothetical protein
MNKKVCSRRLAGNVKGFAFGGEFEKRRARNLPAGRQAKAATSYKS